MAGFRSIALRAVSAAALTAGFGAAEARVAVGVNVGFPGFYASYHGGYPGYYHGGGYYGGYRGYYGYGRPWYGAGYGYGYGYGYGWPGVVIAAPPIVYGEPADPPLVVAQQPAVSARPTRPDPVIYPRNGQDASQQESDRQLCNRWATTQPAAVADASVFQRAVEACMDGRGYSMR